MLRELDSVLCCCGTEALMSQYIKSDLIRCAAFSASILVSRLWETVQPHDALYKKKKKQNKTNQSLCQPVGRCYQTVC